MSTKSGQAAEDEAAHYLQGLGFRIREQNWRTRWCEIDIVAEKAGVVYLVEVKYRRSGYQGSGLDYITPKKLKQMHFAATMWVHDHKWSGDYRLAALAIDGNNCTFVEEL
jgi:uncharacterized protein (TIGR00252 family)